MLSSAKSLNKVESLQKRALRFQYDSYDSAYGSILKLAGKCAMYVNRLRRLSIKILETLSNIDPAFMNEIFELRKINRAVRNLYKLKPRGSYSKSSNLWSQKCWVSWTKNLQFISSSHRAK